MNEPITDQEANEIIADNGVEICEKLVADIASAFRAARDYREPPKDAERDAKEVAKQEYREALEREIAGLRAQIREIDPFNWRAYSWMTPESVGQIAQLESQISELITELVAI